MVLNPHQPVKNYPSRPRKFSKYDNPAESEIPGLIRELSAIASMVPTDQAIGNHVLRSQLLEKIPAWRRLEFMDAMQSGRALS